MKKRIAAIAASALIPFVGVAQEEASEDEKVGLLQGKLESLEEQYTETKNDVLSMKRLKLSGYIQGRYTHNESSVATRLASREGFGVRRGRLKATYDVPWSKLVLQIDATP